METTVFSPDEVRKLREIIASSGHTKPALLEKVVHEVPILTPLQIRQFFTHHSGHVFLPFPERFSTTLASLSDEGTSGQLFSLSINNPSGQITDPEMFEVVSGRALSHTKALSAIAFFVARHLAEEKLRLSLERTNIFCVVEGGVKRKYYLQLQPSKRWMIVCEEKTEVEPWPSGTTIVCGSTSNP